MVYKYLNCEELYKNKYHGYCIYYNTHQVLQPHNKPLGTGVSHIYCNAAVPSKNGRYNTHHITFVIFMKDHS